MNSRCSDSGCSGSDSGCSGSKALLLPEGEKIITTSQNIKQSKQNYIPVLPDPEAYSMSK